MSNIISALSKIKLNVLEIDFDLSLARGINYYTGIVLEVSSPENSPIGSIAGGGRYDNLLSNLGAKRKIPAVGAAINLNSYDN